MKVLLVTDMPPCRNYTAGLVLDRLVRFLQPEQIALCSVVHPSLTPEIPKDLAKIPKLDLKKPHETSLKKIFSSKIGVLIGSVFSFSPEINKKNKISFKKFLLNQIRIFLRVTFDFISFIFELVQSARVRYRLLPQIINFAQQQQVDALWIVLEGQTIIRLAHHLPSKLKLPLFTQVWDPFEWWLRDNHIDKFTQRRLLAQFDRVMNQSISCATASWAMSEDYSKKYNIPNIPVIAGLPRELAKKPATQPHTRTEFIIAIAGQFYAFEEWTCLINALNQNNWVIANRRIRLRILGGDFHHKTKFPANFEYYGWHSQEGTIELLADSDLLYMPYWFSEKFRKESTNSFPSKLVTYFAAGRPVFCHAPAYASPSRYIAQNNAGYLCTSMDVGGILNTIINVISDDETYEKYTYNGTTCFFRDFTLERMQETFFQFLRINTPQVIKNAA